MHTSDGLPRYGRRTLLRRLSPDDLADFQAYRHDPQVGLYQGWTPWPDAQALAFLSEMSRAALFQPEVWFQIGIAERDSAALIGDIGICVAMGESEALIGFSLRASSQGQGLASEAVSAALGLLFERTAVKRVLGIADARNLPSIHLLERLGMQRIETVHAVFRGEACIEHTYALLRPNDAETPLKKAPTD